jgi:anti-sigma B factor antagonist
VAPVTTMGTRRLDETTGVIDITGDLTSAGEGPLMDAYARAGGERLRSIVLNFDGLEYMNSGGIGLLVTLLVRAHRHKQRLLVYGLSEHYRQIFELTRLDDAIGIYLNESEAAAAACAA